MGGFVSLLTTTSKGVGTLIKHPLQNKRRARARSAAAHMAGADANADNSDAFEQEALRLYGSNQPQQLGGDGLGGKGGSGRAATCCTSSCRKGRGSAALCHPSDIGSRPPSGSPSGVEGVQPLHYPSHSIKSGVKALLSHTFSHPRIVRQ